MFVGGRRDKSLDDLNTVLSTLASTCVIGFPQHRLQDSVLAVGSAGRGSGQQPKPLSVAVP